MASHGYNEYHDFDIVDADGYNQYESHAMRRAPQQSTVHMTQQMTTKVAPAYNGRTSFFAFKMQMMTGVISQNWKPRSVEL